MKRQQPWAMASLRHRQTPRVYKPCKPVGSNEGIECSVARGDIPLPKWTCCKGCGHHMCSCEKPATPKLSDGWLGKKAKAVEVQADMQPLSPPDYDSVLNVLRAMRDADPMLAMLKPAGEGPSRCNPGATYKPLSALYLDGIDKALEESASGSASSGLTGIVEGKSTSEKPSTGKITKVDQVADDCVNFEGRPLRVGDLIIGPRTDEDVVGLVHEVSGDVVAYRWVVRDDITKAHCGSKAEYLKRVHDLIEQRWHRYRP